MGRKKEQHHYYGQKRSIQDIKKMGLRRKGKCVGEENSRSILTDEQVFQIKYHDPRLYQWGGVTAIAKEYGVTKSTICAIKYRRTWKHI